MALTGRQEAFRVDAIASGFDHQRSQFVQAFGMYVANSATEFQAGALVDMSSDQEIIVAVGAAAPFGWSKYSKSSAFFGCVVGEYIQLNDTVPTSLAHANLMDTNAATKGPRVADALTGSAYTEDTDFTVNYTNGTIVRIVSGTEPSNGAYVYVNYQYSLTAQQINDRGHNFWNFDDDVTIQGGKVTVITGPSTIFTTAYDPHQTYTIGEILYVCDSTDALPGFCTNSGGNGGATAALAVGTVIQLPTADDPFMGIKSNF